MNWKQLLSTRRYGKPDTKEVDLEIIRTNFQRDYDRLIFSSAFRRLQNKTQVFPLPGSVFVHNRLTHSLEVASIGRSLGNIVARRIESEVEPELKPLIGELGTIVSVAGLAHDLGNPPFGHSGESAISNFFENGDGRTLQKEMTEAEWADLTNFEGNANLLRLLTHQFKGRRPGGMSLTYACLAAMIKYPFASTERLKKGKYGFFQSEREAFLSIVEETGLICTDAQRGIYARSPLAYLMEAADDIAYMIMDIEDAHRLGILSFDETRERLSSFFDGENLSIFKKKLDDVKDVVTDSNELVAFLRAMSINHLTTRTSEVFLNHRNEIMEGTFKGSLVKNLPEKIETEYEESSDMSVRKIYNNRSVVKVEITGYNVLKTLVEEFLQAAMKPDTNYSRKLLQLIPEQYNVDNTTVYGKCRSILDFVSGMTDLYAMDLYKLIRGDNTLVI
ncbi:MAG: deoxyguanosinetriphosphate triphosphohydrolase [Salinivirgaceae bacterium]|nr:deoxyguanosinetriphosphate triphosphohydrolase [Salinivirgaceae bacterium]